MKSSKKEITRKEAIKKLGSYGKYTALTALGTYVMLNPKKAQAGSNHNGNPAPGGSLGDGGSFFGS